MLGIYRLLFLLSLSADICNGYIWRRLTQADEIWQDGRPEWVAGHLPFRFGKLWLRGNPPRPRRAQFWQRTSRRARCDKWPVTAIGMWGYTPVELSGVLVKKLLLLSIEMHLSQLERNGFYICQNR